MGSIGDKLFVFDDLDRGQARTSRHWVFLVRVVAKRKSFTHIELRPANHRRNRQNATPQALANAPGYRDHFIMLTSE